VYRNADPEELAGLHPADRLMVQLIQINRLGPRIEGMLYKVSFEETWSLLDEVRLHFTLYFSSSSWRAFREPRNFQQLVVRSWMPNILKSYSV
jgi:hypothetical protein